MKTLFLCLLGLFIAYNGQSSSETFLTLTIEEAFDLSTRLQKNIFVFYYEDGCDFCKEADREIFMDAEIKELLTENYVSVKADYNKDVYKSWFDRYNVSCLPTIQIINRDGQLLYEHKGGLDREELTKLLGKYETIFEPQPDPVAQDSIAENDPIVEGANVSVEPQKEEQVVSNSSDISANQPIQEVSTKQNLIIQLGAFLKQKNSLRYQSQLLSMYQISTTIYQSTEDDFYRVFADKPPANEELQDLLQKVRNLQLEYWKRDVIGKEGIFQTLDDSDL